MKRTKLQIILISILTLGVISLIICINLNIGKVNNDDYLPTPIQSNETLVKEIDLNNYQQIYLEKRQFPLFNELQSGQTYFDTDLSYKDYELTTISVSLGEIIKKDQFIGKVDDEDIKIDCNGMVTDVDVNKITIKILDKTYIKFSFDIYSSKFNIGDDFDIFKMDNLVANGKIISIDYLNIVDDKATAIIEIDNSSLVFLNDTTVYFTRSNKYSNRKNYSTYASYFNIYDGGYNVLNIYKDVLCIRNNTAYNISFKLGICFGYYVEVLNAAYLGSSSFNLSEGTFYVKLSSN